MSMSEPEARGPEEALARYVPWIVMSS
jgi:hypothetical protein